jgi:asparagine synthase (glutamine-hydrolysing)
MCGLVAGFAVVGGNLPAKRLHTALGTMVRRGPDGSGEWSDDGVWLGHRRLAVIDLAARAQQPMQSPCGRYIIAFNGEIYNFQELRRDLSRAGVMFKTNSDTEVLLALFAARGPAMLTELRGMFAFVIWDRTERRAFAARDPYGIKPLYYSQTKDGAFVASQVRALIATGSTTREICSRAQASFWMLGHVAEPYTWYRDIRALPAGSYMWIRDGQCDQTTTWWDIGAAWRQNELCTQSLDDVQEMTREALRQSARAHLVSDVPVGVFLSGGIDSTALAGLLVEQGAHGLVGVSLAFEEFAGTGDDEIPAAKAAARQYGIEHHVRTVTKDEFVSDLPRIVAAMDQPSVDGINTWYASKAAAECGLKVVVSGVGGDELFQGYKSFQQLPRLVNACGALSAIPGGQALLQALCNIQAARTGNERWRHLPSWGQTVSGAWWLRRGLFSPSELPSMMGADAAIEALCDFTPERWVADSVGQIPADAKLALGQIESMTYLRNQLLRDSDWASMDHSIELRTPLVDAWLLRDVSRGLGSFKRFPKKRLLSEAPNSPLPLSVTGRQKTGFSIPMRHWLQEAGRIKNIGASAGWAKQIVSHYGQGSL